MKDNRISVSDERQPLVSIITVTKDAEQFLELCIQSVICQSYPNIEYIVFDGMSVDSTLEIIKQYENHIDYWTSQADISMYDAINKAIEKSTGDIVAILNSDDRYVNNDVISNVVNAITQTNADGIYGDMFIDYGKYSRYKKVFQVSFDQLLVSGKGTFVPHPTLFLKRDFVKTVGLYDLKFKYASDFEFILRCLKKLKIYYDISSTFIKYYCIWQPQRRTSSNTKKVFLFAS